MIGSERAFPNQWSGQQCQGLTKAEHAQIEIVKAIVTGLYSFQGGLGQLTEAEIVKAAKAVVAAMTSKA